MSRNVPEKILTKGGHRPRARIHAGWSPIGQKLRRTAMFRGLGVVLAVLLVIGFAADAYAQSFFDSLPSIQGLDSAAFAGDTIITDRNGVLLADVGNHGDHRLAVKLKDVAPVMIQSTVAIEDKGFYTNPGFDLAGIVRAGFDNLRAGHVVGGGSTITQQLAKQQFLTPDQTVSRKIKELALAYELAQTYSKDQIMELYLNKSFYGSQSYGIEAAAESYFHIPASKLDLAQAAVLAGLPQAPTEWNPVLHPDAAKLRQTEVLQAMVRSNFISQEDMDKALAEKLTYQAPINSFLAPHFVDYVLAELRQLGFQPGVQQLSVRTTLDMRMQQIGEQVVSDNLAANLFRDRRGQLSSGMIAEDPKTGEIWVMVGSPNYNSPGGQINFTTIPRNMGSSMKPYTYGAVINARAATVDTPVYDGPSPLIYKDAYSTTKFYNYDGRTHGVLPLKKAMGNSLNIAAVKVELSIGVPAVLSYMRNLNVRPRYVIANPDGSFGGYDANAPADAYGPSLTLGGYPITLLEHVSGIATYADMGIYHSPESIMSVTDSHGQALYTTHADQRARQALDPAVAFIMAQIMADDQNRCMIFGCNSALHWKDRIVAAKTGTTDNFKDAVTIAFTPDLAAGLWVGDILSNAYTMIAGSDGVFVASPGVHTFVSGALANTPGNRWYTAPPGVIAGANNSWFLGDTTNIPKLPGDNPPSPTPKPVDYSVPPDPGGPVLASPPPSPAPVVDQYGCVFPLVGPKPCH
ncbi:MAG TPA: transglycosylase domain-containing protein [Candidatus Dormibacteraeota bacterium]|nr:transglycosylase domain-containing protein [Candidatus Dormibacteraeota bacterium]